MSKPLGKPDRIVVALGGNALGNNPVEQIEAVSNTAHALLGSSSRATRSSSPTATARRSA